MDIVQHLRGFGRVLPEYAPIAKFLEDEVGAMQARIKDLEAQLEAQASQIEGLKSANIENVAIYKEIIDGLAKQIEAMKSAEKTLRQMGYTNEGGEYWKPPLGKAPDFDLLNSLHMQIEALQADAERCRWLRDYSYGASPLNECGVMVWCVSGKGGDDCSPTFGEKLDSLIDAARKQGGEA